MTLTDYMHQEKKEKEDLPVLKTALTHWYKDSKTTYKRAKEDRNQQNNTNDTRMSGMTITRKQKWEEKQINERFKRLTSNISLKET